MSIQEKIAVDLKAAMIARDSNTAETLRGLKSALLYEEVALKKRDTGLSEDEVLSVMKREAKKRTDAIALYDKAGRQDSSDKERTELDLITSYLPETLSEEDTKVIINEAIQELGIDAPDRSDTGKIIGAVKGKAGASVDMAVVARLVNENIS